MRRSGRDRSAVSDLPERERRLLLFDRYPRLREQIAWTPIGHWPTPILRAGGFADRAGLDALYIKREDLSHPECGGNKTRGLEFLIGRARELGADCMVTFSSAGSHHISKTAWHARRFGIDTVAVFVDQPVSDYVRRNIGAALASGARYVRANRLTVIPRTLRVYLWERWRRQRMGSPFPKGGSMWPLTGAAHRPVYFVAPGGTNRRSMLGHVNAALELKAQVDAGEMPAPDYVYVVLGSLGTAAGLALGLKLTGMRTRVVGITVSYPWYCTACRLARFARRVNRWMREADRRVPDADIRARDFTIVNEALGSGYALFTERSKSVARMLFETAGLRMDGTYTAKGLDGMLRFIEQSESQSAIHLFWHTYFEFPPCALGAEDVPRAVRRYFATPGQAWDIDEIP